MTSLPEDQSRINSRQSLIYHLQHYTTSFAEEAAFAPLFIELLTHAHCYRRDHLPGHITGSAWIVDEQKKCCLLTHHAKLDRWLQPGGHADGDEHVARVALREAVEETGLQNIMFGDNGIFDIDVHSIPERNGFPQHLHYDVRFAMRARMTDKLIVTVESHALEWIPLDMLERITNQNDSILRMAKKHLAAELLRHDQHQGKRQHHHPKLVLTDCINVYIA
ncbi:MAG: NUDIX domain-containing protein [Bacteroidia bacterium]|nr:NUDIX domain-containing protein [Bacteroidia bacterium]